MKAYVYSKNFAKAKSLINFLEIKSILKPNIVTYNTYLQCAIETEHF